MKFRMEPDKIAHWQRRMLGFSSLMFVLTQVELRFFPNGHGQLISTLVAACMVASSLCSVVDNARCTWALWATQFLFLALSLWFAVH